MSTAATPDRTERLAAYTNDGRPYCVVKDITEVKAALIELAFILDSLPELSEEFFDLFKSGFDVATVDILNKTTDRTIEVIILLKPSERFLNWITAHRARKPDNFTPIG